MNVLRGWNDRDQLQLQELNRLVVCVLNDRIGLPIANNGAHDRYKLIEAWRTTFRVECSGSVVLQSRVTVMF